MIDRWMASVQPIEGEEAFGQLRESVSGLRRRLSSPWAATILLAARPVWAYSVGSIRLHSSKPSSRLGKGSCFPVSNLLIFSSLGIVAAAIGAAALWFRSSQSEDMGSVSHTWVAELRAGEPYDSSR